jgi:hypothetical protein
MEFDDFSRGAANKLEFKQLVLIYAILVFLLFYIKPEIFSLHCGANQSENRALRRRKFLMLVALFIILAILTYYIKIYIELYWS